MNYPHYSKVKHIYKNNNYFPIMSKTALITGITGQDGSYLSELLLNKGYDVHGLVRRTSTFNRERIDHLHSFANAEKNNLILHYSDITDTSNIFNIINEVKPDEIYHLAAQSHVGISFKTPEYTSDVDALGTLRLLEGIRCVQSEYGYAVKIYNASSSEMFGDVDCSSQSEDTPFNPQSPYSASKVFSYHISKIYRDAYNMFVCNGILFNHESPRRGKNFITRKITTGIANIINGKQKCIYVGNLDSKRDWGYAPDYVEAMWMMLQQDKPDDYVIATGESHSVREFIEIAFKKVNIDIEWKGRGLDEIGVNAKTGDVLIKVSPDYFRPLDVNYLLGDATKARQKLGWKPKVRFDELIDIMLNADLKGTF